VLIDHQVGTMQLIKTLDVAQVKRFTLALAKAARILGMPVILTSSQEDRLQGPLMPELAELLPEAFARRIKRAGIVNAWSDPNFLAAIEATGRKQIIMGGVTTDVCLIYPTISAVRAGYQVQAVLDISGSPFALSEEVSRKRMEVAGVSFTATNTVIAELAQDWSTPRGRQLIQLLFSDILPPIRPEGSAGAAASEPAEASARELVARVFRADHALDVQAFVSLLSPAASFKIGPMPAAVGHQPIAAAVAGLFAQMAGIEHRLEQLLARGSTISYTATVRFSRKGQRDLVLPYLNVLRLGADGLIDSYTIDIDLSALGKP